MTYYRRLRKNRSFRRTHTHHGRTFLTLSTTALLFAGGLFASLTPTNSSAASACGLFASTSGSDANDGSSGRPFATAQKLVSSLAPGQTGCLASGQTFSGGLNLYSGGSSSGTVTVTSTDPTNPATIFGRVVTHPAASYITFTNLKFDWDSGGQNLPSMTIGSDHVSIVYDDIQNGNTSICIDLIADPTWGTAHATLIDHNRIHNCGQRPVTSYSSPGYFSHALYISGIGATVTNNYIYGASGKGVLLRGSSGAYVGNNTIDSNGTGVDFGDLNASNNEVARNLITNSGAGCACNAFGVFSWWGTTGVGTGNTFHDNCLYGNQDGNISTSGGGFTATSNTIASPSYTNASGADYTLRSGSACGGFGAAGTPGAGGGAAPAGSSSTTTTVGPAPSTTAATTTTTTAPATTTAPTTTTTTTTTTTPTTTTIRPTSTVLPVISGSAVVGSTLTTTSGSWSGTGPIAFTYQWQRCALSGGCSPIGTATGTSYQPTTGDGGMAVRVVVTASNGAGSTTASSNATGAVSTPVPSPTLAAAPQIGGDPHVGGTLTASTGTWNNSVSTYSYSWLRCDRHSGDCTQISGATSASYTASQADFNSSLRVMVNAQNDGGTATATSGATAFVKH
jgi:hypothetical protein